MNLRKIRSLDNKVQREAEKAVGDIYQRYSDEMNKLLAETIPTGVTLRQGNGMEWLEDSEGNSLGSGKAWGFSTNNPQLGIIADLQYSNRQDGNFQLHEIIKGRNPVKIGVDFLGKEKYNR